MIMAALQRRRWNIVIAGTLLQLCLGTVYAWSYFQKPLMQAYDWTNSQVAWIFSLTILFLSLGAAGGGMLLPKLGPRRLALSGAILFSGGYFVAAAALRLHSLPLLYLGYGLIGGMGLGLCYVTPVATVSKWFPDKKGLATGMVVMGFGFGALLMSKLLAPGLMAWTDHDLSALFRWLGLIFLALTLPLAWVLRNPPAVYCAALAPASDLSAAGNRLDGQRARAADSYLASIIWLVFFCNIVAGVMLIGFQSPLLQDLLKGLDPSLSVDRLACYGASLIAASSLFNGAGRLVWGWLSDRIGRVQAFRSMLGTQVLIFITLALLGQRVNPWLFGILVCYVLFCYGGGFGAMPALVLDAFGAKKMSMIYGLMLTAWGVGGIVGPQLAAWIKDSYLSQAGRLTFSAGAIFLTVGFATSLFLSSARLSRQQPKP